MQRSRVGKKALRDLKGEIAMFLTASCPISFRNPGIAIVTFALCFGLSFTSYAQSNPSKTQEAAIRPFKVNIPEKDLVDLRRRIAATRWPDKETVTDQSQGV
jgi:hypothetical protein